VTGRTTEPSFVLSGPTGTVLARGASANYTQPSTAAAALRRGTARIILGAFPFDLSAAAALFTPNSVSFTDTLPDWPETPLPSSRVAQRLPESSEHRARVTEAVRRLRGQAGLQKVVLARAVRITSDEPWDARMVVRRLARADPCAYVYLADLTPAGGPYTGTALVGASPELLVDRHGDTVTCRPFAGSAPRSADPDVDRANAAALAESGKNHHEHQLVIDVMRDVLEPLCSDLHVTPHPTLYHTEALWHLGTTITGRLRETSTTAMDLALALHPTPAVGGVPTDAAVAVIDELEGDRGFYAGAVGWCDAHGDGRWVVSIRCAQLSADRRTALAHTGGGIVAESDPGDELDETTTKFRTILAGLGGPK